MQAPYGQPIAIVGAQANCNLQNENKEVTLKLYDALVVNGVYKATVN